jgi:calcium-dependent protein kinase
MAKLHTKVGTPFYISPEVLSGNYDESCDLWSAGCILYCMLCGYPPFYGDDNQEIMTKVMMRNYVFEGEEWMSVSKDAINLVKKLICTPEKRLSAGEALDHKWFKKMLKNDNNEKVSQIQNIRHLKKTQQYSKMHQATLIAIAL